ncbi:MAG: energy transducer TonB [Bacteroidales bacterium]|nr:energy transducer TonB [Bacteroidales bacterium]
MKQEDKAGIYTTVIIHLAVLIVLLATSLGFSLQSENSFVLDFSKLEELERLQEEVERLRKEAEFQQAISDRLEAEIGAAPGGYRNVAVDRAALKDDRGTDADQLYKDAERLAKELKGGFEVPEDDFTANVPSKDEGKKKEQKTYSGPSVVSYYLEGRKASKLSIPAYRCMGAGEVTVLITVDNSGTVIAAKIDESCSSSDGCLRSFAIRAARLSRFSADPKAPARQQGNIVYKFIAQ